MSVYIDTSAFLATLDADDLNHVTAKRIWCDLLTHNERLVCSSYVLLETYALIQKRLSWDALRTFHESIYRLLHVYWVDAHTHESAATATLIANRKRLSLVDCVSFTVMRDLGIKRAFAFDAHFQEQGFTCLN